MSDCVCREGDPCVFHASQSAPKSHNLSEFSAVAHWRDRKTGRMMVGTQLAKASYQLAEEEYERAMRK
jgi:hypothetical protein